MCVKYECNLDLTSTHNLNLDCILVALVNRMTAIECMIVTVSQVGYSNFVIY